ncbi:transcription factor A, mitochondrial [Nilaparvata lugens]|uniref:transcription factor A, mitochondrial n=1 Tax=Nilaparvata lugens TaxID=108931 RepID=UPI00193C88BD|nr:transcription factor A, mitochondrial [Nilaparvata lugens]XP_022207452.2 transcription factor A, mitochondrial [Nilaparvata lugens]
MALLISNICRLSTLTSCRQFLWPRVNCLTVEPKAGLKQSIEEKLNLPEKPKKPITPFFRFASLHRPELKEKHPGISIVELSKKLARKWEGADLQMKQEMIERYKREMDEYAKAKMKYAVSLTDEQKDAVKRLKTEVFEEKKKRRLKKKSKDLGKPKRPVSSYLMYAAARKDQRGDLSLYEWQVQLSREWDQLSKEQKKPYEDQTKRDFENYKRELAIWEANMIKEGHLDIVRTEALEPKAKKQIKK